MLSRFGSRAAGAARRVNIVRAQAPVRHFTDAKKRDQASVLSQDMAVPMNEPPPVVKPPGEDIKTVAQRLDPAIAERLTPTLKKFTLTDKVAVVTG